ncbi:MAG TPA: response regulator [Opitutaceae bacterium]|nr:response regulator [Opitutaceae bacterium]
MNPPTVLIVDDNAALREMLLQVFALCGFKALAAADATAALRLTDTIVFGAALVDLELPGMKGIELCRALRTRSDRPPLVWVMTGGDDERIKAEALSAGAVEVWRKPFPAFELCARIRRRLAGGGCDPTDGTDPLFFSAA